jgi:hypothetical protein
MWERRARNDWMALVRAGAGQRRVELDGFVDLELHVDCEVPHRSAQGGALATGGRLGRCNCHQVQLPPTVTAV